MYGQTLNSIYKNRPLVYVLTNNVTNGFVADVLLALGCRPIMAVDPREAGVITSKADALCINTGTPNPLYKKSYSRALRSARRGKIPLVLDSPGAGVSPLRLQIGSRLTGYMQKHRSPEWKTLIRGNASEILTLASGISRGGTIDTAHSPSDVVQQAKSLLNCCGAVSISGERDITLGQGITHREGAGPLFSSASGFGCANAAVMAAFMTELSPEEASIAASELFHHLYSTLSPKGPGSLKVDFIDRLYSLSSGEKQEKNHA